MKDIFYRILFPDTKDPVHYCEVHKEIGCSHVDGMLCNFPECDVLKEYKITGDLTNE
jgi:hypothetical protein